MKNKYRTIGDVTLIYITSKTYGEYEAVIDTVDLPKVNKAVTWYVNWSKKPKKHYVVGRFKNKENKVTIKGLHRVILGVNKSSIMVDHVNHDSLDNRKVNLRAVTSGENMQNGRVKSNNTSGINGVSQVRNYKKWRSHIKVNDKSIHLGYFNNKKEALLARIAAEKKYFKYKQSIKDETPALFKIDAPNTTKEKNIQS